MSPFWPLNHEADIGLLVRASDLKGLFVESAKGLVLLLVGEFPVVPAGWRTLTLEAPEAEELLVDFLSEILYLANSEGLAAVQVELPELSQTRLEARLGVVPVDRLGQLKEEIKGVTYHHLELKRTDQGLETELVFDV